MPEHAQTQTPPAKIIARNILNAALNDVSSAEAMKEDRTITFRQALIQSEVIDFSGLVKLLDAIAEEKVPQTDLLPLVSQQDGKPVTTSTSRIQLELETLQDGLKPLAKALIHDREIAHRKEEELTKTIQAANQDDNHPQHDNTFVLACERKTSQTMQGKLEENSLILADVEAALGKLSQSFAPQNRSGPTK